MIPADAVEAARGVLLPYVDDEHFDLSDVARAALEAAAPYMLKQGWDEGYKAGLFDKEYYSHNPNPYMLNNEGEK